MTAVAWTRRTGWLLIAVLAGGAWAATRFGVADAEHRHGQARDGDAAASGNAMERVAVHDNRDAAGVLDGSTLTVRLEARRGEWFPDGDGKQSLGVHAFSAGGGPLQVPGPLIRVTQGTTVRAHVTNRLDAPLAMHGMYSRDGQPASTADEVALVPPGETREMTFRAERVGTYFYWAASNAATLIEERAPADTQLSGAIVVDPPGTPVPDRILFIGAWDNGTPLGSPEYRFRFVINGRSWPLTERLTYAVGDIVRMRVVNAGAGVHPMHLHGFYFNVDSRGNEREDTVFPPGSSPRLVVTERLAPGRTFSLTWKPTRPGNWLFHCHDNVHLDHGGPVDGGPYPPRIGHVHADNHLEMMAGPVIGIAVTGTSVEAPEPDRPRRQIGLVARVDTGGTDEEPAFGYTLDSPGGLPPVSPYLPGPTLVLTRGEPVSITVRNALPEPTAVHWHGIELESYYDGVAGFAGEGERVAPAIAPGGSFEARFTPPRSGTFMYHTHLDDTRQQQAGLTGALLVVDDIAQYDTEHDLVFLITVPRKTADSGVVLVNGSETPPPHVLRAGARYRLRFLNLHTFRPSMRMRVLEGTTLQRWRLVAKDGMDLPADQAVEGPSEIQMGNGETYDFEFIPATPGDLRLDVVTGAGGLLATMPIRVR
jgi:manganese oxidase